MSVKFSPSPKIKTYELSQEEIILKRNNYRRIKKQVIKNRRISNILYRDVINKDEYVENRIHGKERMRFISSFFKNCEELDRMIYYNKKNGVKIMYNIFLNEHNKIVAKVEMFNMYGMITYTKTKYFDHSFDFLTVYENEYDAKKFVIITLKDLLFDREIH